MTDLGSVDLADIFGVKYPLTLRDFLTARLSGASMAEAVLSRLTASTPAAKDKTLRELISAMDDLHAVLDAMWNDPQRYNKYVREMHAKKICVAQAICADALAALGGGDG